MLKDDPIAGEVYTSQVEEIAAAKSDYETERNKPMPNIIHGAIQAKLIVLLDKYSKSYLFVSELSLDTTPGSTPDISVFQKKKLDVKTVTAKESEAPLTTIEIVSPSQSINEMMHKAWDLYFPMGVKSSWIVVPELKAIHIIMPDENNLYFANGTLKDPVTGIEIPVERVFEDLI